MNIGNKLTGVLATAVLLTGLSSTANAAYIDTSWDDLDTWQGLLLTDCTRLACESSDPFYYVHDITTTADGYRPGVDKIDSAWVRIWLSDDKDQNSEAADIDISPFLLGIGELGLGGGGSYNFAASFNTFNVNVLGLLDLRADGRLGIYIEPTQGDFYLSASLLHATGQRLVSDVRSVPEPGTLALLSIGVISMGVALRRRRNPLLRDKK